MTKRYVNKEMRKHKCYVINRQMYCAICENDAQGIHHIFSGHGIRELSDKFGYFIPLCGFCHDVAHDKHSKYELRLNPHIWRFEFPTTQPRLAEKCAKTFCEIINVNYDEAVLYVHRMVGSSNGGGLPDEAEMRKRAGRIKIMEERWSK